MVNEYDDADKEQLGPPGNQSRALPTAIAAFRAYSFRLAEMRLVVGKRPRTEDEK